MSSCHSIPDDTVADPTFRPTDSDANTKKPTVTVSSYLKLPLEKIGAELARSAAGSEDIARISTNVANLAYDALNATGPRPVVTRSMVERAIRQDGIERVLALSELNMRGRKKIYDIRYQASCISFHISTNSVQFLSIDVLYLNESSLKHLLLNFRPRSLF